MCTNTHIQEKKKTKREVQKRPWDQKESMQTPHTSTFPARVTCDFHSEGQCGQTGTWVIRRGCERRKKGSLAHSEREDKMPTKYLCSWLVASGKWDINNYDDWSTPGSGNSLVWEAGDVGSSPGFNTSLFCDLMESLQVLVYKWGNNKT